MELDRHTTIGDLSQTEFKRIGKLARLNDGKFIIIAEFESNLNISRLARVGISFASSEMKIRNEHGWSDDDVKSMKTMMDNKLRPMINPNAVDLDGMLDCYCNWIKSNVPITDFQNPSAELKAELLSKSKRCAEQNRK
jgi:hypothetical protein